MKQKDKVTEKRGKDIKRDRVKKERKEMQRARKQNRETDTETEMISVAVKIIRRLLELSRLSVISIYNYTIHIYRVTQCLTV